ncbi:MAG TPA: NAD(+)/NADH kinase, partial [Clostridiaceae bacterium]|nr:NAD(+)/NADH kinase [Clostridiaceae bacterium]
MKVGLLSNRYKDPDLIVLKRVDKILRQLGCDVQIVHQGKSIEKNGLPIFSESQATFQGCDLVLSLGGDGTFLNAVHATTANNTPVAGINLGSLGFLAEIMPADLEISLMRLVQGDYEIEERMMLDAKVIDSDGKRLHHYFSLNEVVLSRGNAPRILPIELWIDN